MHGATEVTASGLPAGRSSFRSGARPTTGRPRGAALALARVRLGRQRPVLGLLDTALGRLDWGVEEGSRWDAQRGSEGLLSRERWDPPLALDFAHVLPRNAGESSDIGLAQTSAETHPGKRGRPVRAGRSNLWR